MQTDRNPHGTLYAGQHLQFSLYMQTGIAGHRLLWSNFLPPHLMGAVQHNFLQKFFQSYFKMQICGLWFIYGLCTMVLCHIFLAVSMFFHSSDRMRWISNMACLFLWYQYLRLLTVAVFKACCLCYRRHWCQDFQQQIPNGYEMTWTTRGIFQVRWSLFGHARWCRFGCALFIHPIYCTST